MTILPNTRAVDATRVLFIGHDATRTGAPIVLLDVLRWLRNNSAIDFVLLLERGGPLLDEYRALCPVHVMQEEVFAPRGAVACLKSIPKLGPKLLNRAHAARAKRLLGKIKAFSPALVYANTVATRHSVELVESLSIPIVLHAHELEMCIRLQTGISDFNFLATRATRFIAASPAVARNFVENHGVTAERIDVVYSFTDTSRTPTGPRSERRRALCRELGITVEDVTLVGAVGTLDWRKGTDLFVQLAARVVPRQHERVHFVWLAAIRRMR